MENNYNNPLHKRHGKDKEILLNSITERIEKGTQTSISELKRQYSEENVFHIGLKHITTTKKALCTALQIPVEAGCRYKRSLEKGGKLVQSIDPVICPVTKHPARLLSTNPKEFKRLLKSNTNQLNIF